MYHLPYHGGYTVGYTPSLHYPGYTSRYTLPLPCPLLPLLADVRVSGEQPGLKEGERPGCEPPFQLKVLKCEVRYASARRVTPAPAENKQKDWIANG